VCNIIIQHQPFRALQWHGLAVLCWKKRCHIVVILVVGDTDRLQLIVWHCYIIFYGIKHRPLIGEELSLHHFYSTQTVIQSS
jgi:hypothetical protein